MLSYAESDSEGAESVDDDVFRPVPKKRAARPSKKRKVSQSPDEDVYNDEDNNANDDIDDGRLSWTCPFCQYADLIGDVDDFIVPDESDEEVQRPVKRKRGARLQSRKTSSRSSPKADLDDDSVELPEASTAQQWTYDPENPRPLQPRSVNVQSKTPQTRSYETVLSQCRRS